MSFPRHLDYAKTAIEWLPQVPAHWAVVRLKDCCEVLPSNVDKKSHDGEMTVRLCNYTDVYYNDEIAPCLDLMEATASDEQIAKFTLCAGDTLITKDSETADDIGVSALVPNDMPGVVCGYHLAVLRPRPDLDGAFLKRLFDSRYVRSSLAVRANGLTRVGLSTSAIGTLQVAVPPVEEQRMIAAFLTREIGKLDALVTEQERLVELLKEKRHAVISRAVTEGFDPGAMKKPSEIAWLGDVPAHWNVAPIKHLIVSIEQGWSPQCESIPAETDDEWGVLKVGCVNGGSFDPDENKLLPADLQPVPELGLARGDLLVSRANTRELVGSAAVVARDYPRRLLCDKLYRLRFDPGVVDQQFIAFYLGSRAGRVQIELQATGASASMVNISQSAILELPIAIPPINEQRSILDTLRGQLVAIDTLTRESTHAIALLRERRTSVISAATTGQIDVRQDVVAARPVRKAYSSGFARQLLAAEILSRFHSHPTMGRVKLQKLMHLCEYVGEVADVSGEYRREAAGPFDQRLMFGVAKGLKQQGWYGEIKNKGRAVYVPLQHAGDHAKYLAPWKEQMRGIDKVLQLLGEATTGQCEIVSTLYAAWNDLLIDGKVPNDTEIVREATALWHPSKATIESKRWPRALDWMRKHDLVPMGFGAHTRRTSIAAKDDV